MKTHKLSGSRMYHIWQSMKQRCTNPNCKARDRYWWRWIKLCDKRYTFMGFYEDMIDTYQDWLSIDRIDNDGNYCKENCRWATWQEQYENMSINHNVVYKWKWYPTIAKMCRALGVRYQLVRDRIRYWWSIEDAVDLPLWVKRDVKKRKVL